MSQDDVCSRCDRKCYQAKDHAWGKPIWSMSFGMTIQTCSRCGALRKPHADVAKAVQS